MSKVYHNHSVKTFYRNTKKKLASKDYITAYKHVLSYKKNIMKKHAFALLLFFITTLTIAFNACKSEENITLKFSPTVAKKYEISMDYVQNIDMGGMGEMQNTILFVYHLLIKEKDADQNTIILTTFKKIGFNTKSPQGDMSFDSDVDATPDDMGSAMISKIFGGLIGQSFSMVVNKNGEVVEVKGMTEIFDNMIERVGLDTMQGGKQAIAGFKEQFSDEQVKKNFSESFNMLPNKNIKIGDTWNISTDKSVMGMGIKTENTYTLKEIKGNQAIVDIVSTFLTDKTEEGMLAMEMDGTQTGTLKIDINTGLTIEGDIKQMINGTQVGGQGMSMKINGIIKITSKEIN